MTNEVRRFLLQQFNGVIGTMRWSIILLKDKRIACNVLERWQHLLREKDIAVILAVDFYSAVDSFTFYLLALECLQSETTLIILGS